MPKVLITDDDQKLLKMLKRTLAYENMDVLTASNGVEAREIVRDQQPDVIILDWMMPDRDGVELIERLPEM